MKQGKNPGYPRFKSKRNFRQSYKSKCVGKNIKVLDNAVQLPKLGRVKCRVSKEVKGRILSATVSHNPSGKYFVALCCTDVEIPTLSSIGTVVGLDMGIQSFAITSDGMEHSNPKYLVRSYDLIAIEDLTPSNMVKNRKVAKAISDASWGEFRRQLKYKSAWHGKQVVTVDRFFPSSQLYSICGVQWPGTKDLSVREWTYPACGTIHDRERNAAQNILKEGLRLLA